MIIKNRLNTAKKITRNYAATVFLIISLPSSLQQQHIKTLFEKIIYFLKLIISHFCMIIFLAALTACSNKKRNRVFYKYPPHTVQDVIVGKYSKDKTYTINSKKYQTIKDIEYYKQDGLASWYGKKHNGKLTASGEYFDSNKLTCAHRTLPLGSAVKVTSAETGKSIILLVTDRGPFPKKNNHNRVIDVSEGAAKALGFKSHGLIKVRVEYLEEETKLLSKLRNDQQIDNRKLSKSHKTRGQKIVNKLVHRLNSNDRTCVSV